VPLQVLLSTKMVLRQMLALCALVACVVPAAADEPVCQEYKQYLQDLDYCADPLYWSHYKIRSDADLAAAQVTARTEYELIRDAIYWNTELLAFTKIERSRLADCIGFAQRIACHRAVPRCSGGESQTLCKSMCQTFHDRCTVDGVDFVQRGMGKSYDLYTCDGLAEDHCSAGARGATLAAAVVASLVLAASVMLAY